MVTQVSAERALLLYADAHRKLYKRLPRELRAIDHDWVIVNGARVQASELQYLTAHLLQAHNRHNVQKRSIVTRLIDWFKQ